MTKYSSNKGETHLKIEGDIFELMVDTFAFIHSVYEALKDDNIHAANLFKQMTTEYIDKAFLTDAELEEDVKKIPEEQMQMLEEFENVLNMLRGE